MKPLADRRQGEPLLFLAIVLVGWIGMRLAGHVSLAAQPPEAAVSQAEGVPIFTVHQSPVLPSALSVEPAFLPFAGTALQLGGKARELRRAVSPSAEAIRPPTVVNPPAWVPTQAPVVLSEKPNADASSALRPLALAVGKVERGPPAALPSRLAESRWSADSWLLLRQDDSTPFAAAQPSYGRSQVGAVLRYRLAAGGHRPQACLRGSLALAGPRERELAFGLSARPIGSLPVRFAAEGRATDTPLGTEIRLAAYAATEFPPLALPLGVRGELYLQAGYVGGRFATAFVDGQARAERVVMRLGATQFSAGAGLWGGAQEDAARLDVGPSAAVRFPIGDLTGRLSADYRFRIAGDAQPASGPALTLSAGF